MEDTDNKRKLQQHNQGLENNNNKVEGEDHNQDWPRVKFKDFPFDRESANMEGVDNAMGAPFKELVEVQTGEN